MSQRRRFFYVMGRAVFLLAALLAGEPISMAQDEAPQIDCREPPVESTWRDIFRCVENRKAKLILASGRKVGGKVRALKGQDCRLNATCMVQVRGNFQSRREVASEEIVSVQYRPSPTRKRTLVAWSVGIAVTAALTVKLFGGQCDDCWILGLPFTGPFGIGAGYLTALTKPVEVRIIQRMPTGPSPTSPALER